MSPEAAKPMTWQLSAAIRDAVGLTSDQKAFLWNITSHHQHREFGSRGLIMRRTGLTDWRFRKVVKFLKEHGLIRVVEHPGDVTWYSIRYAALKALATANNPVAAANAAERRQPPTPAVSAPTSPPRRSAKTTPVGAHHGTHGGHQHQKSKREVATEDHQENRRPDRVSEPVRKVRVPVRRKLTPEAQREIERQELDIFD